MLRFLAGAFLETHRLAEEPVRFQRHPTGVVGSETDPQVAWTFPEIITASEARLRVLREQMGRLSEERHDDDDGPLAGLRRAEQLHAASALAGDGAEPASRVAHLRRPCQC